MLQRYYLGTRSIDERLSLEEENQLFTQLISERAKLSASSRMVFCISAYGFLESCLKDFSEFVKECGNSNSGTVTSENVSVGNDGARNGAVGNFTSGNVVSGNSGAKNDTLGNGNTYNYDAKRSGVDCISSNSEQQDTSKKIFLEISDKLTENKLSKDNLLRLYFALDYLCTQDKINYLAEKWAKNVLEQPNSYANETSYQSLKDFYFVMRLSSAKIENIKSIMINKNTGLLSFFARKYSHHIEYSDAFQEGAIALLKAINSFDMQKETRFSTYAEHAIENKIKKAVNDKHMMRIPQNASANIIKIQQAINYLFIRNGQYPDEDEISEFIGMSKKMIRRLNTAHYLAKVDSLDAPANSEIDQTPLVELISDGNLPELNIQFGDKAGLERLMHQLTPRERNILYCRYAEKMTLKEVGDGLNLTRERIRQIETKSLKKLKKKI